MDAKTAKPKRPPTAAQTALQEKKALIRAEIKKSLAKHNIPYAIGMNAQAVKGWNIGLRGEDLMSFMLDVREQKAITKAAAPATRIAAPVSKRTPPGSIKPVTKAAAPATKTTAYGATKKKTLQNKLNEINAIMAGISKPATKAAATKVAATKAVAANTRRAKLPRYYQRHAERSAMPSTPSPNMGAWKKYEHNTRKTGPHRQNAKNAEIARLKGELSRLKARCAKLNQTSYLASQMPSPPMRENNENLEVFLAENNNF